MPERLNREDILARDDWSGANLSSMSLGCCDLRGKIFRGTDLSYAHLGYADLRGADLRNADLTGANLGAADLRGADLRHCDLRNTNLVETKLDGADLRDGMLEQPNAYLRSVNIPWTETEEFQAAKEAGFFPMSYWGEQYQLDGAGTLYHDKKSWSNIKKKLGILVFGDRETFEEVRLVQQYSNYAQWAYMLTRKGFERMIRQLGLNIRPK